MNELFMFSKAVSSGEKVELYVYSQSIKCGHERGYDIVRRDKTVVTEPLEKREDSMFRSRQNVRHIIWANMGRYTKFVTLTYAETVLLLAQKKPRLLQRLLSRKKDETTPE